MNEFIEFIYNQIDNDYEASLEMYKNRIPVDLAYLRSVTGLAHDEQLVQLKVDIPGVVTREALLSSENQGHMVAVFAPTRPDEKESQLGYEGGELFIEEDGGRRVLNTPDLEAVQVAQALRIVLMQATFMDDK
ncbi:MAG: hypothetical protein WAW80_02380 [Candidatus Saccharimonadales bacterium]